MDNNERLADMVDAFEVWKIMAGQSAAPYLTDEVIEDNLKAICEYAALNVPGGKGQAGQAGYFEIGFAGALQEGLLKRDDSWVSQATKDAVLQKELDTLPAAELKRRYFDEPAVRRLIDGGR